MLTIQSTQQQQAISILSSIPGFSPNSFAAPRCQIGHRSSSRDPPALPPPGPFPLNLARTLSAWIFFVVVSLVATKARVLQRFFESCPFNFLV